MSKPLISIMTPCFNAAETLPRALASLVAQTFEDWECIVVDDGSTDTTCQVVEQAGDPRVRLVRHDENRGRGAARQTALNAARGEFLAMQDADDWAYPEKLRTQLAILLACPKLPLVSAGLAIVDQDNKVVGVRSCDADRPGSVRIQHLRKIGPPPLAFPASLIRMDAAQAAGYDISLRFSEDMDFLIRLLHKQPYAVIAEPLYAYAAPVSLTPAKMQSSFESCRAIFGKYSRRYPLQSAYSRAKTIGKQMTYAVAGKVGMFDGLVARGLRTPTDEQNADFEAARAEVESSLAAAFSRPPARVANQ